jgi:hypothetical protein
MTASTTEKAASSLLAIHDTVRFALIDDVGRRRNGPSFTSVVAGRSLKGVDHAQNNRKETIDRQCD